MELSATITQQQFNQDMIQSNLRDIFEPNSYIVSKPEKSRFSEIKTSISEMIESIISPSDISLNDKINEKFLELDFGSEFTIDATKIGINDAIFFVNLLKQDSTINYSVETEEADENPKTTLTIKAGTCEANANVQVIYSYTQDEVVLNAVESASATGEAYLTKKNTQSANSFSSTICSTRGDR